MGARPTFPGRDAFTHASHFTFFRRRLFFRYTPTPRPVGDKWARYVNRALPFNRYLPIEPSTAPVFSFPPAAADFGKSEKLTQEISAFGCDRGAEWTATADDGTQINLLYFEADTIQDQPLRDVALHKPEVCNGNLGHQLKEVYQRRIHHPSGKTPLVFDSTCFVTPSGAEMFMFKLVWVQGRGSIEFREPKGIRVERLKNSFNRQPRAARILQAGVFNARDPDHAWEIFRKQVLDQLKW